MREGGRVGGTERGSELQVDWTRGGDPGGSGRAGWTRIMSVSEIMGGRDKIHTAIAHDDPSLRPTRWILHWI